MILGPYRNPPYRAPTPRTTSASLSPPPPSANGGSSNHNHHHHLRTSSPKRRFSDQESHASTTIAPADSPRLLPADTTTWTSEGSALVPDSPRSKVAERLKGLAIRQPVTQPVGSAPIPRSSASPSPRKKARRSPPHQIRDWRGAVQARQLLVGRERVIDGGLVRTPERVGVRGVEIPDSEVGNTTLVLEVDEARFSGDDDDDDDGEDDDGRLPPTPLKEDGFNDLHRAVDMVMSSADDGTRRSRSDMSSNPRTNKRMLSPPPPSPLGQVSQRGNEHSTNKDYFGDKSPDSPFSDDGTNFDPVSLTWQDSEITGHEITSPDDDGEGINGIGFRPTPAIAYARSQKRRQQVEGWKAREAREARQKRLDRRRAPSGRGRSVDLTATSDAMEHDGAERRTVRFAT